MVKAEHSMISTEQAIASGHALFTPYTSNFPILENHRGLPSVATMRDPVQEPTAGPDSTSGVGTILGVAATSQSGRTSVSSVLFQCRYAGNRKMFLT